MRGRILEAGREREIKRGVREKDIRERERERERGRGGRKNRVRRMRNRGETERKMDVTRKR